MLHWIIRRSNTELRRAEAMLSSLNDRLEMTMKENVELKFSLHEQTQQISILKNDNNILHKQLLQLTEELSVKQQQMATMNKMIDDLKSMQTNLQMESQRQRDQITELAARVGKLM